MQNCPKRIHGNTDTAAVCKHTDRRVKTAYHTYVPNKKQAYPPAPSTFETGACVIRALPHLCIFQCQNCVGRHPRLRLYHLHHPAPTGEYIDWENWHYRCDICGHAQLSQKSDDAFYRSKCVTAHGEGYPALLKKNVHRGHLSMASTAQGKITTVHTKTKSDHRSKLI